MSTIVQNELSEVSQLLNNITPGCNNVPLFNRTMIILQHIWKYSSEEADIIRKIALNYPRFSKKQKLQIRSSPPISCITTMDTNMRTVVLMASDIMIGTICAKGKTNDIPTYFLIKNRFVCNKVNENFLSPY